jgi:hypothetical protein
VATLALACYALYLALAFGLRTLLQLRRTGSTAMLPTSAIREYAALVGRFVPGIDLLYVFCSALCATSQGGRATAPTQA